MFIRILSSTCLSYEVSFTCNSKGKARLLESCYHKCSAKKPPYMVKHSKRQWKQNLLQFEFNFFWRHIEGRNFSKYVVHVTGHWRAIWKKKYALLIFFQSGSIFLKTKLTRFEKKSNFIEHYFSKRVLKSIFINEIFFTETLIIPNMIRELMIVI